MQKQAINIDYCRDGFAEVVVVVSGVVRVIVVVAAVGVVVVSVAIGLVVEILVVANNVVVAVDIVA